MAHLQLTEAEAELWHAVKKLGSLSLAAVERAIEGATGLSGADFSVLSRLEDLGGGVLTQQALGVSLAWDKSRLSHQLTRMERRALLRRERSKSRGSTQVLILPKGRKAIRAARPVHADAVRRHVLQHIRAADAKAILRVMRNIQGSEAS